MRMWGVDPKLMCNQHLLGEHVEMHMFIGCLEKGIRLNGYIDSGLVEVHNIINRHDDLAAEMFCRGMNHRSPLVFRGTLPTLGCVDVDKNIEELSRRCPVCNVCISRRKR